MNFEPAHNRLPLATVPLRIASFVLDFCACVFIGKLIEALLGINEANLWIFALVWAGDRILIAGNNQGQSLGRWLVSLKTVDMYYGRVSGMAELAKRELVVSPFLAILLLASKSPTSAALFAVLPLVVDAAFAIADSRKVQTLHDRLGGTIVIFTRRGFQLNQKLAKVFRLIRQLPIPNFPTPDFTRRTSQEYFTFKTPKKSNSKRRPRNRD
jgi:uncharacterized RDD family membrane protein YckC